MTYELLKRLKECGFKQVGHGGYYPGFSDTFGRNPREVFLERQNTEQFYNPTLEELIEELGDKISEIGNLANITGHTGWRVNTKEINGKRYNGFDETLKGALINLYLVLHELAK